MSLRAVGLPTVAVLALTLLTWAPSADRLDDCASVPAAAPSTPPECPDTPAAAPLERPKPVARSEGSATAKFDVREAAVEEATLADAEAEPALEGPAQQVGRAQAQQAGTAREQLESTEQDEKASALPEEAATAQEQQRVVSPRVVIPPVQLVLPLTFQSQLSEPAPASWLPEWTPYCAAAAAIMVMRALDPHLAAGHGLASTFAIGRRGNTTLDPGLDPDGIAYLMRIFGGEGRIHVEASRYLWLDDLIGRLNHRVPVVAITQAGVHAVTVYGYEAIPGGDVTALYVADPLSAFIGRVGIDEWFRSSEWMGARFATLGPRWQGSYVFVSYRDFR